MQRHRQFVAACLFLIFAIVVLSGGSVGVRAQPPGPGNGGTAVGEAVHIAVAGGGAQERARLADSFTFLPMVSGAGETGGPGPEAQRVAALTNAERAKEGCPPLQVSAQLTEAAQGHSEDMALNDFFSHKGSDDRTLGDRIRATGYDFWMAAENIAAGQETPEDVMAAWMSSEGHRNNILNCALEDIGVGFYYLANDVGDMNYHYYWTQDFGTRK